MDTEGAIENVCIKGVSVLRGFFSPETNQTVCNNEVSVLSGCPWSGGLTVPEISPCLTLKTLFLVEGKADWSHEHGESNLRSALSVHCDVCSWKRKCLFIWLDTRLMVFCVLLGTVCWHSVVLLLFTRPQKPFLTSWVLIWWIYSFRWVPCFDSILLHRQPMLTYWS